jgi:hypothetical protein
VLALRRRPARADSAASYVGAAHACREPQAERVADKTRQLRDYFAMGRRAGDRTGKRTAEDARDARTSVQSSLSPHEGRAALALVATVVIGLVASRF